MEIKPIPWIKREDFEFIDGRLLLAIKKREISFPIIVWSLGNDKLESWFGEYKVYKTTDFDYYAVITYPTIKEE